MCSTPTWEKQVVLTTQEVREGCPTRCPLPPQTQCARPNFARHSLRQGTASLATSVGLHTAKTNFASQGPCTRASACANSSSCDARAHMASSATLLTRPKNMRAALKEPTATPPPRKPGPRPPFGFPFRGPAPMRPGRPPFGGSRYRPPIPRRPICPQAFRGRPPFPPGGRGYPRAPMPGAMHPAAPQATAPHARAGGMTQAGDVAGFARMQGGYAAVGYGQHATAADAQLQHGGAHHPQHQHQHQLHQQGLQQQQQQHHQQHQQQAFGMTAHTTPAAVQSAATLAQFTHHPSPAQQSMHAHQQHQHQHQQQHAQQQQHQHQHQQHQQQQQQQQVPSAAYYDQYFFAGAYTQQGVAQSPVPALSPVTAPAPQAFGGFAAQQLQASPMPQTTNAQATGAYFHFQAEHMQ
ncbi:hypothetical protein PTSG_04195 [Salpingoeca rosetta]|uniref:Uncharacterized protein n=1 Tax=Salpingoeca rosetta (strain ATCC 50818 / BSB-021) TaxID=946362 RepID=F2U6V5_SALR5|nr:uncharacterized protein PTSG_04195 [Salpingoeca rosetta]EGD83587.1 hypothetical protein PTSG_04195 [Salpingoeca rosetta]|eukprot:XP_004995091.1 hypothetical protein PTSG_04195 [Salpingoeca rosetta]